MNSNSIKSLTIATLITLSTITAQAITTSDEIGKIYTATFDRVPDQAGLDYWLKSGLSIDQIAQSFFDQDETKALYPDGTTSDEFINSIYKNLFAKSADADGLEYWKKELENGNIPKSKFILAIINGALGEDKTTLSEKQKVSQAFLDAGIDHDKYSKSVMDKYNSEGLEEALDEIAQRKQTLEDKQEKAEQIQAELESFDEKFSTDEFAGYSATSALRLKVLKGEMTAFEAEKSARKAINAKKLAEQNKIDEAELDAALYDSTDLTSTQINSVKTIFNKDGLSDALAKIKAYEEENEKEDEPAPYVPPSSGGGYVAPPPVDTPDPVDPGPSGREE